MILTKIPFTRKKKYASKTGLPPGTLVHVGEKRIESIRITLFRYNNDHLLEERLQVIEEALTQHEPSMITWLNIDGLHDISVVEKVGTKYKLHPLILEDILNTSQPPKCEDYEQYLFIVLKMLTWDDQKDHVHSEHISLVLGPDYVISFQEEPGDVFEMIRERIRTGKGRIRKMSGDYLVYALIDAIVDYYFVILDRLGEKIETLEEELTEHPEDRLLHRIHGLKRELISLKKSIWPLREMINSLIKTDSELINDSSHPYLRDLYDHSIQVIETTESYRDIVSGLLDLYMSTISNRMNNVMKVLTIIATIFIPLTFIAGVYGMNFDHMPELHWKWGYLAVWIAMLSAGGLMIWLFKKNKWL